MASSLYGLARTVSEYARQRFGKQYQKLDETIERTQPSVYVRTRRSLSQRFTDLLFGKKDEPRQQAEPGQPHSPGSPPWQTGAPPIQSLPGGFGENSGGLQESAPRASEELDEIQILGRDAGYDPADFAAVMAGTRLTPGSSNVYGYYFEREARRTGILYVTFLGTMPGGARGGAGPTYAYYDVSVIKANAFQKASEASAGNAVWDYLRIRGTVAGHQHNYRLVHVTGEYVPRKATPVGYRNRAVPALGIGRREFRRNTLPAMRFSRGEPNRAGPNRGAPGRGD
ncbi:MAG: hypothetical protein ACO1RT_16185 [Planctomycetaceae bacterium]